MLDVDRVLQLITDRVRDLVGAQYAAIGIVDADGAIERFITSGISDEQRARIGDLPRGRGLLGLIIREDRTYRIPDITRHPERYGFPPHHPEMHAFLGMPIRARGEVVGRLYLTNKLRRRRVQRGRPGAGRDVRAPRRHRDRQRPAPRPGAAPGDRRRARADQPRPARLRDPGDLRADAGTRRRARAHRRGPGRGRAAGWTRRSTHSTPSSATSATSSSGCARSCSRAARWPTVSSTSPPSSVAAAASKVEVDVAGDDHAVDLPIETVAELLALTREALSNVARHAAASHAWVRLQADDRRRAPRAGRRRPRLRRRPLRRSAATMDWRTCARAPRRSARGFEVESAPGSGTRIIVTMPRRAGRTTGDQP